jgi:hypothetical protein
VSEKAADTSEAAPAGGATTPSNPIDSFGFSAAVAWLIGSLAKITESLIPTQGNAVWRLGKFLGWLSC